MNLSEYLKSEGIKQYVFAEKLGVSQSCLTQLLSGDRKPSLSLAVDIENITKGKVKCKIWIQNLRKKKEENENVLC